jgi:hypothetical protein
MRSPMPSIGRRLRSEGVMIEVYFFLAVFAVQILAMSVLYPVRFARVIRKALAKVPAERLRELYPEVDVGHAHERFLTRYRAANIVVALAGLALLAWFPRYMQNPDWDEGRVGGMITAYFLLQHVPIALIAWFMARFNKVHRRWSPDPRRKAVLQRRGLFDFVSPQFVLLAVLSYSLFVALNFYVVRHPFPGYGGPLLNIGIITSGYVVGAFFVFQMLYGRKKDPLQTPADRLRVIHLTVNCYVWMAVLVPIFSSLSFARKILDLDAWGPFLGAMICLLMSLISLRVVAPRRGAGEDDLGSRPVHQ